MTIKSRRKKKSSKGKKPKALEKVETRLTGTKATDLYSSLNDSIFQDSFDKFVGDRDVRRIQLNLRKDVRASFNRDSSLECSTNDAVATDQNPLKLYAVCSTPNIKRNGGHQKPFVSFCGIAPNSQSETYSSSDLFESYAESERNGSRIAAFTTCPSQKQNEISVYTVASSVNSIKYPNYDDDASSEIESSVLHGNFKADEMSKNIFGKLNAETNSSNQSNSTSNNYSSIKRKVTSRKKVPTCKVPNVTTRRHQRLINESQAIIDEKILVSLDDRQLESDSIRSSGQLSSRSDYEIPVGRVLRSSIKRQLANASKSANSFSASSFSNVTNLSLHSSSNMSFGSSLSASQNLSSTVPSESDIMDISSESEASSHMSEGIDCNQNCTQELPSIKCDKVDRTLRSSSKQSILANESIFLQSRNSSAVLVDDLQECESQTLAQVHPHQENTEESFPKLGRVCNPFLPKAKRKYFEECFGKIGEEMKCSKNTKANESAGQNIENKTDINNSKPFHDVTNTSKRNYQNERGRLNERTRTEHDQSAVSSPIKRGQSQSKENIQPIGSDKCSIGKVNPVKCNYSTELRLTNRKEIPSSYVTLRKRKNANVNNLPVLMESPDPANENTTQFSSLNDVVQKEVEILEINETASMTQNKFMQGENTIRLKSGKWRRQFSLYRRQTLSLRQAFILEQTDVESTNQLKVSLPNESHRQTLRHSVSFNLCRDTFVDFNETSDRRAVRQRRTSVLNPIGVGRLIDSDFSPATFKARDTVLRKCQQSEPLEFDEIYSESALQKCRKIGEGVYGEVFMNKTDAGRAVVLKIIPIEGFIEVNGEQQKKFDEILSEIIIALELSSLRNGKEFMTTSFTEVVQIRCVQGRYPQHLIDLWELYRDNYQTENDHPEIFTDDQLYIVLELANGGQDLEAFQFTNALQSKSAFQQTTLALAVAEKKFQFEHRDLHWGNILLAPTDDKFINFKLNGNLFQIPSEGIKVTIIDYTLSRMRYKDIVLYNDLSNDDELFAAHNDYQFDIYRMMKSNLDNDWRRFEPFNNVLWLHYIADKLINGARYKNPKSRKHRLAIEQLMVIRDVLTDYKSAEDCTNIE